MQEKILSVLYSGLNVIGTIWAVYSVISMTPEDTAKTVTLDNCLNADKSMVVQKSETSYGIGLIITGFLGQTILTFAPVPNWYIFVIFLLASVIVIVLAVKVTATCDRKFKDRCAKG